ncbi:NAD(P)/FAD-dependent oxidoreductase [Methanosphaera sp. BMS]|uniref:NAD(P)/FAD-dependent oxidoreductase n=1 Tax=Methanosphaera sp. BMS TaxID=1789762 RepID=UPI000DC1C5BE|nr:FAD-dependent oxidoreductase [Methanosphaera sp. BMS]AWX33125.1 thioredoxin reductase [Methanosphaera sp. BMS]
MYDVVIIGAGPAGLTAGIYAGRAGLNALIIDSKQVGGTVNNAPLIENYPAFEAIEGMKLIEMMASQTKKYAEIKEFTPVSEVSKTKDNFIIKTSDEDIEAKKVIFATGTNVRSLDAPGIEEYAGRGVSYCAVCDGNFFVDKEVLVVGGGNSAAVEALYLNRIGVKCSLVHRRDKLRCDAKLQKDLEDNNIKIYWNSEVKSVNGDVFVESATLINNKTNEEITVDINGIFLSIGHDPNSQLAQSSGVECNEYGYIIVDENMATSVEGAYAAGDVTGGIKQITVATAQGAIASSDIQSKLM